jgi:hypothetical protein
MVVQKNTTLLQYIVVLAVVLPLTMGIVWLINFLFIDSYVIGLTGNMMAFDSRLWRAGEHREDMLMNLLFTHKLIGLTHGEVTKLLGPELPSPCSGVLPEYGILVRSYYWMMITYDKNSCVSKVRIRYLGS